MWMFLSLTHLILRLSKYFISLFSDPESDNHQKNQPKNHGWICSVVAKTRLEISVSWSDLFSSSGNSPRDFCLLVFTNNAESDCPGWFPFLESDRPSWFCRSIKTRNRPVERTHARTHTHVVIIYKTSGCPCPSDTMKSPFFFKPRETHNGRTVTGDKVIGEKSKWPERKLIKKKVNDKKINGEKVVIEESKCDKVLFYWKINNK